MTIEISEKYPELLHSAYKQANYLEVPKYILGNIVAWAGSFAISAQLYGLVPKGENYTLHLISGAIVTACGIALSVLSARNLQKYKQNMKNLESKLIQGETK
jgi:hypothetical protein